MSENQISARIALFVQALHGGGAERVMVNLANSFSERGVKTDLLLAVAEGPYLSDVAPTVNVVDFGGRHTIQALPGLVRYLRSERPDALLSTMAHANVIAVWASSLARVSTRVVLRETNTHSKRLVNDRGLKAPIIRRLIKMYYPRADAVIAPSQGVLDDLVHHFGVPEELLHQVYSPTVSSKLRDSAAADLSDPWFGDGHPAVVLSVGRLSRQKDYGTLIRAFALARERRPMRLVILGEGEEREVLEIMVQEMRLTNDVRMPGFVNNPFKYMSRADVFVLSSTWEGLPNVLIEAMACGTPVVSTDCPSGPTEILDGGRYGTLVRPRDVEGMASAMLETIDRGKDEAVIGRLLERASEFSVEKATAGYLQVLLQEVPGGARPERAGDNGDVHASAG